VIIGVAYTFFEFVLRDLKHLVGLYVRLLQIKICFCRHNGIQLTGNTFHTLKLFVLVLL